MGKFKLKKLAHVMPQAWFTSTMKERDNDEGNPHSYCNKAPSPSKHFGAHSNKHPYLIHKAIDTHFPATPNKSSPKACREEPPAKPAFKQQLESLHGGSDSCSTKPGLPHESLYKCTMSPASRKLCAGIILDDDGGQSSNTYIHSKMMPNDQALSNNAPCNISSMTSKEKNFHLDVQELDAKLKALSSQERLRSLYISPLFSIAVPSPSLDGAHADSYSRHDSLGTSLRYSLERQPQCRKTGDSFFYDQDSSSSANFSPYSSCSSSGTCIYKKAPASTMCAREGHYVDSSDDDWQYDLFTTIEAHSLLQRLSCREQNGTETREEEAKGKQFHTQIPSPDNHYGFYCKRGCRRLSKSTGKRDKNASVLELGAGLGSKICTLEAQASLENRQANDVGGRSSPCLQRDVSGEDIDQSRPVFSNIEAPCVSMPYLYTHPRHRKSYTDETLSLSDSELACKIYGKLNMMQKEKTSTDVDSELRLAAINHHENERKSIDPPIQAKEDGLPAARIRLLKSSSTRSLDSSLSHLNTVFIMGPSSLYYGNPFNDQDGNPSFSESSSKRSLDASQPLLSKNLLKQGIETMDTKGSSKLFSDHASQLLLAENALADKLGIDKKDMRAGSRDQFGYGGALIAAVPSVSKGGFHDKVAPSTHDHCHKESGDCTLPRMHQDKLYYRKSPKQLKCTCMRNANFPSVRRNRPSTNGLPLYSNHKGIYGNQDKQARDKDVQFCMHREMPLLSKCSRSARCNNDSSDVTAHYHNAQWNLKKDMCMHDHLSSVDKYRDSLCKSSSSTDFSDTSSDTEYHKKVREHVSPSLSGSSGRRSLGDHLSMCRYQNEGKCHLSADLGSRGHTAATTQSHSRCVIGRTVCCNEAQYKYKEMEASMVNRGSCSDVQHIDDVNTRMIGRRSCSSPQHSEDIEARMIGWRRCSSAAQFDVEPGDESASMSSAEYDIKDNNKVSMLGRRSCSARVEYDKAQYNGLTVPYGADITERAVGKRSCSRRLQYKKSPSNNPIRPSDKDVEDRVTGRRSCSSAQSEKFMCKSDQRNEDIEKQMIKKSCSRVQYDMEDKDASMIVEGRRALTQISRNGSRAQLHNVTDRDQGSMMISGTRLRRRCRDAKNDKEEEEESCQRAVQEGGRCKEEGMQRSWSSSCRKAPETCSSKEVDDDIVQLQANVMWSCNMRQDFRDSMMDVLYQVHVHAEDAGDDDVRLDEELLELVGCYLALNPPCHHASILYAFGDLCSLLFH